MGALLFTPVIMVSLGRCVGAVNGVTAGLVGTTGAALAAGVAGAAAGGLGAEVPAIGTVRCASRNALLSPYGIPVGAETGIGLPICKSVRFVYPLDLPLGITTNP